MSQQPAAPYRVEFEARGDHLHACITGDFPGLEGASRVWMRIARESAARGTRRLLVTHGEGRRAGPDDVRRVGAVVADLGFGRLRMAVVYRSDVVSFAPALEQFATAHGLVAKVCGSEAEALAFLRAG